MGLAVYIYSTGTVVLCFGGICCILQQFACLLACLLQIKAKQTWATTHHNITLLLWTNCLLERSVGMCVCVCVCVFSRFSFVLGGYHWMHARENCSGLQAAGSFIKAPNGYHFLWKPSTERKKKKKNHPSFVYSHTHMLTYVPVKYQNPDDIPAQVLRLVLCQKYQRLSPPPPPPLLSFYCHLKERTKETTIISFSSPTHKIYVPSSSSSCCSVRFCETWQFQKKLKNFQNTQFQQNHPRVVGTVDSFLWVSKSSLLSQLPYCIIQAKVRGRGVK